MTITHRSMRMPTSRVAPPRVIRDPTSASSSAPSTMTLGRKRRHDQSRLSRAGYYAWTSRAPCAREVADGVLTTQIRAAFDGNRKVSGAPWIHAELIDADVHVGRKRVARLMREAGIVGCHRRKRSFSITKQNPKADVAPDLVDRQFTATAPNQLWVADVTYVPTVQGWLYLACVTDVFSRMILGWSMASHRKTDLVVDAVTMAVHHRGGKVPSMIHHSDRSGNTLPTSSSVNYVATAPWPAWEASRTASITRWLKASSRPWSASCSTNSPEAGSTQDTKPSSPSSTTWRPSTTPADGTPPTARSAPQRSRNASKKALRHDHDRSNPVSAKAGQLQQAIAIPSTPF